MDDMPPPTTKARRRPDAESGWYVYGIVEPDIEVLPEARGIGDPPAPVELVRSGDVAALVSEIDLNEPIGRPEDLRAHQRLLDATIADTTVLPMRFGAVVVSRDAVQRELLDAHQEQFADTLRALAGQVEYVVRARYIEDTLIREVLDENPSAVALAEQLHDRPADATRNLRLELGEIVSDAVDAKRNADTDAVVDRLSRVAVDAAVRPPTHEQDAAHVAVLVETEREDELDKALLRLAREWEGRATIRLLGPMAPYDFVTTDLDTEG
jgi:hypothetical protein